MRFMTNAESNERTIEALKEFAAALQRFADETQKAVATFHASAKARAELRQSEIRSTDSDVP